VCVEHRLRGKEKEIRSITRVRVHAAFTVSIRDSAGENVRQRSAIVIGCERGWRDRLADAFFRLRIYFF